MKAISTALFALSFLTASFAEEKPNLDDPKARNQILAEAIDKHSLQKRGKKGEELAYAPNEHTPYTGWAQSSMFVKPTGRVQWFSQYKDGEEEGLYVSWHKNGRKKVEAKLEDGKFDGLLVVYNKDGQKNREINYKEGKYHGLWITYNEEGTEKSRRTYKDGERVKD